MSCDFPAEALLKYRRTMAREADNSKAPGTLRKCAQSALLVEQLRLLHEDICGCQCWYEAVNAEAAKAAAA